MRIAITGSRGITNLTADHIQSLVEACNLPTDKVIINGEEVERPYISMVLSGGAPGVDRSVQSWAVQNGHHFTELKPNWNVEGPTGEMILDRAAAFKRNRYMAGLCDVAIVITDGEDVGTEQFIDRIKQTGKTLYQFKRANYGQSFRDFEFTVVPGVRAQQLNLYTGEIEEVVNDIKAEAV